MKIVGFAFAGLEARPYLPTGQHCELTGLATDAETARRQHKGCQHRANRSTLEADASYARLTGECYQALFPCGRGARPDGTRAGHRSRQAGVGPGASSAALAEFASGCRTARGGGVIHGFPACELALATLSGSPFAHANSLVGMIQTVTHMLLHLGPESHGPSLGYEPLSCLK